MKPLYAVAGVLFVLVGVGVGTLLSTTNTESVVSDDDTRESVNSPYREIVNPSGFVNSEKFTIQELVGKKVILVDFMTYSCINCQRTFPYVNAWYEKYKDQGLVVVGIHTPEFAFEKDIRNVRDAMKKFGITHPIVLDNEYATWNAYGNKYWPRKYLIDIHGNIVYDHIGEGAYEETEKRIQELLMERARVLGDEGEVETDLVASQIPQSSSGAGSPETYFGAWRNSNFASAVPGVEGVQTFSAPENPQLNKLYLSGTWKISNEYAESSADSGVYFKYSAKEVFIVAGSLDGQRVEVLIDGKPIPSISRGADVVDLDGRTFILVQENRLYKIIKDLTTEERLIQLKVPENVQIFTFTFG